jgi:hypothetical protein
MMAQLAGDDITAVALMKAGAIWEQVVEVYL